MVILYCISSIIFIWMNLFFLSNISKLKNKPYFQDWKEIPKVQIFYYLSKVLYWFWLIIGLFLPISFFIYLIIAINGLKIISYFLNRKIYTIFNIVVPISTTLIISSMLISLFF